MLLDFFAKTHAPGIHARGRAGTLALFRALNLSSGQHILELGFGTGESLVELSALAPGARLSGAEVSPLMLATARRRLRWCGKKEIALHLYAGKLPFADASFDVVYCESVLAIQPDAVLTGLFAEIYRVLKPGGVFGCNESLWLPGTSGETVRAINQTCYAGFGLIQASERYAFPDTWRSLGTNAGFQMEQMQSLQNIPAAGRISWRRIFNCSELFSRLGWLKGMIFPDYRQARREWKALEKTFEPYGRFLEGWLFVFRKPE